MTSWITDEDYYDINIEMVRIASKYIPELITKAMEEQLSTDVTRAKLLLAKHGISIEVPEGGDLAWRMVFNTERG